MPLPSVFNRLLHDEQEMGTGLYLDSASSRFGRGLSAAPPSSMDAIMGSGTSNYIGQNLGIGFLTGPVAKAHLQSAVAARQKLGFGGGLTPFDFIAAAHHQANADTLKNLIGNPGASGVSYGPVTNQNPQRRAG